MRKNKMKSQTLLYPHIIPNLKTVSGTRKFKKDKTSEREGTPLHQPRPPQRRRQWRTLPRRVAARGCFSADCTATARSRRLPPSAPLRRYWGGGHMQVPPWPPPFMATTTPCCLSPFFPNHTQTLKENEKRKWKSRTVREIREYGDWEIERNWWKCERKKEKRRRRKGRRKLRF